MNVDDLRTVAYRALETLGPLVDPNHEIFALYEQARELRLCDYEFASDGTVRVVPMRAKPPTQIACVDVIEKPPTQVAGVEGIDSYGGMGEAPQPALDFRPAQSGQAVVLTSVPLGCAGIGTWRAAVQDKDKP